MVMGIVPVKEIAMTMITLFIPMRLKAVMEKTMIVTTRLMKVEMIIAMMTFIVMAPKAALPEHVPAAKNLIAVV